jgi:hypothetical protein
MTIQTTSLGASYLVFCRSELKGNVRSTHTQLTEETLAADGSASESWETLRTVKNVDEHKRALVERSAARWAISKSCVSLSFGLVCPTSKREELEKGIEEARRIVEAFNATATHDKLRLTVMVGEVKSNDQEAIRAIRNEVADLVAELQVAINNLDTKAISTITSRAKNVSKLLDEDGSKLVQGAIEAARAIRKDIVKAGEVASVAIDEEQLKVLERARVAFVDLNETAAPIETAPEVAGRAIDLEPEALPDELPTAPGRQIDFDAPAEPF